MPGGYKNGVYLVSNKQGKKQVVTASSIYFAKKMAFPSENCIAQLIGFTDEESKRHL